MKISGRLFLLMVMCVAAVPVSAFAGDASPDRATRTFYNLYMQVKPLGIPDVAVRAKFEPLVTPELLSKLAEAQAVEQKHFIATKNQEPPYFQGDPFSSLYEGATSYKIGQCVTEGARSYCDVDLTYTEQSGNKPTTWTDKLILVKRVGGWKVDDISFGATWDFGQHGTLRATLGDVIRAGTE